MRQWSECRLLHVMQVPKALTADEIAAMRAEMEEQMKAELREKGVNKIDAAQLKKLQEEAALRAKQEAVGYIALLLLLASTAQEGRE